MGVGSFFEGKCISNLRFEPTEDQKTLIEALSAFVTGEDQNEILMVCGYAGTGKTSTISAFVKTLKELKYRYVLLAPTGRSAKVLAGFTGESAYTIHKQIYRQQSFNNGIGKFVLDFSTTSNTIFIVDEASLITTESASSSMFGSGNLLDDLFKYIKAKSGNKIIFIGDKGQLPPIGMEKSPALDESQLAIYGGVSSVSLSQVVRQAAESGILYNATRIRQITAREDAEYGTIPMPELVTDGFADIEKITGGELIEKLTDAYEKYGSDGVIVICRSNKMANRYNQGIRSSILYREEKMVRGDRVMVVKNCYHFEDKDENDDFFIANGDVAEVMRISNHEERYGLHFAKVRLSFPDYDDMEIVTKVILDTLDSNSPNLTAEESKALFQGVYDDYDNVKSIQKRYKAVREDEYFNAMQIKYAAAMTCHKTQGGGWPCVFIHNPFWQDELTMEDLKWLYTAITRATKMVYLVNFTENNRTSKK
ncbi:MAG: AAA family ATPase [Bacteroidales bacterium]|nr:AAA family ATPase [Bacteroidales bacterium]